MKRGWLLFVFTLLTGGNLFAQAGATDSVTIIATYKYKVTSKDETIGMLEKQLNTDARLLLKLNTKYIDTGQVIPAGKSIIVPIIAGKTGMAANDAALRQAKYQTVKQGDTSLRAQPKAEKPGPNFEVQKNRLFLIDATLELDETLLEGVKASIDTLNAPPGKPVDEKNMKATLLKMERDRDRVMQMPYLIRMKDSLNGDIAGLKKEKQVIENHFNATEKKLIQEEYGGSVSEPVAAASGHDSVLPTVLKDSSKAKSKLPEHRDTLIRQQAANQHAAEPEKPHKATQHEPAHAIEPAHSDTDSADLSQQETSKPAKNSGDTAAYVSKYQLYKSLDSTVWKRSDSVNTLKVEIYLAKAHMAMKEKGYPAAEQYLQKALDIDPHSYDAWLSLAEVHSNMGLVLKAISEYRISEKIDSTKPEIYDRLGDAYLKLGLKNEAYLHYEKALSKDSAYLPAIMGRALVLTQRKEYAQAIADYNRVLNINITYHRVYKMRGIAEYLKSDYKQAINDFTRYLIFEENDGVAYYYRGIAKISLGQKEEGCEDLKSAEKLKYPKAGSTIDKNCR